MIVIRGYKTKGSFLFTLLRSLSETFIYIPKIRGTSECWF